MSGLIAWIPETKSTIPKPTTFQVIEMTTALPATVRDLERALAPAGVAVLDLESIVKTHIKPLMRAAATMRTTKSHPLERYPWFVLAALVALIAAVALGVRRAAA